MPRWYSATVLQTNAGVRRLWQLSANGGHFAVQEEATLLLNEPCPPAVVGKDWQTLFRKKLNIAWLPLDKVFFRAVQLPSSDPSEVASMVELQLENGQSGGEQRKAGTLLRHVIRRLRRGWTEPRNVPGFLFFS